MISMQNWTILIWQDMKYQFKVDRVASLGEKLFRTDPALRHAESTDLLKSS